MFSTNDWFYFTEGLDKKTCNKIRNSAKGKWEKSGVDTKENITDEERISGAKPIYDIDILARDGKLIRSLVRRRLNPKVPNEGHIIEKFDELYSIANKLVQVLKLSWLYDCDFMLNKAGQPKLLEINPRPSGSLAVSLAAGVNFIEDIIAIEK